MTEKALKIAVIGSGSWATALVKVILENGHHVNWWVRRDDKLQYIKNFHHNPEQVSSITLDFQNLALTSDINGAVMNADMVLLAVPSLYLASVLDGLGHPLEGKIIVSAIKGILPDKYYTVSRYLKEKGVPYSRLGVVSGPTHAEEIGSEKDSYLTLSSSEKPVIDLLQLALDNRYIKTFRSNDIKGIEYAGVLKNVAAMVTGICHGMGYGDNFMAVLIANMGRQIADALSKQVGNNRDYYHSVYFGDLLVTCYSHFSRNRTFGHMIGKGYSAQAAKLELGMVAEGYFACKAVYEMNWGIPFNSFCYSVLYEGLSPHQEIDKLKGTFK